VTDQRSRASDEHRFQIIGGPQLLPVLRAKRCSQVNYLVFHIANDAPPDSSENRLGNKLMVQNFSRLLYNENDQILLFEGSIKCPALRHAIIRCRGRYHLKTRNGWVTIRWL